MEKDELDRVLQEWADRRHVSVSDEIMVDQVIKRLKMVSPESELVQVRPARWVVWLAAAACLAAAILLASAFREEDSVAVEDESAILRGLADLPPHEVKRQIRVLSELQHLFPEGIAWTVDANDHMDIHLNQEVAGRSPAASSPSLLLRFSMLRRNDEGQWQRKFGCQMAVSFERVAEAGTAEESEKATYRAWVHRFPDGLFMLDANIGLSIGKRVDLSASVVLRPNQPCRLATLPFGELWVVADELSIAEKETSLQ